ncbi:helix-turn-helix domain-containing protein [Curtobacterium sp. L1-20]|uniref:helix-turn-helix domain-containing protein n=1 Tax=Curtobacterium sp. L1-20 TaxID=3138181 RepID=UPI003B52D89D
MSNAATYEGAFARGVRLHREQRGESQQWLADQMRDAGHEWHQSTVYKVETGKRKVMVEEAASIADIFGVPIAQLLASSDRVVAMNRVLTSAHSLADTIYELDVMALKAHRLRAALAVACADYDDLEDSWEIHFGDTPPVPATAAHASLINFDAADAYAVDVRRRWLDIAPLMNEYANVERLEDFPPRTEGQQDG